MVSTLILVPTELERSRLVSRLADRTRSESVLELCGFGAIAAAARTTQLIAAHRPQRVILVGIAGALSDDLAVGAACTFQEVACYGIGAGTGTEHRSASEMGWHHWPGVGEVVALSPASASARGKLLTVCAASVNQDDVRHRLQKHPDACAEDMEGFAVALACELAGLPLQIIRGISNVAGEREKARWQIGEALDAAADLLVQALAADNP